MSRASFLIPLMLIGVSAPVFAAAPATRPQSRPANPAMQPIVDNPALPRVLLIGDSISIGYTLPVRERLKGKANVHRPGTNCSATIQGLAQLDKWLGDPATPK